jgi:uncharacterized cupin superfamily protein
MQKIIKKKLTEKEIEAMGIRQWPLWEKEVSKFYWSYPSDEECLIIEGEVIIETNEGKVTVRAGDFVTFKEGLDCYWDVKKNIRKHYRMK